MRSFMSPGKRIRSFRLKRGMTQRALGRAVGFPAKTADIRIAQYESGARTPKHDLLCAFAQTLEVPVSALEVLKLQLVGEYIVPFMGIVSTGFCISALRASRMTSFPS